MSRRAAEDSFAALRLFQTDTNYHGLQPWLRSNAAPRLANPSGTVLMADTTSGTKSGVPRRVAHRGGDKQSNGDYRRQVVREPCLMADRFEPQRYRLGGSAED